MKYHCVTSDRVNTWIIIDWEDKRAVCQWLTVTNVSPLIDPLHVLHHLPLAVWPVLPHHVHGGQIPTGHTYGKFMWVKLVCITVNKLSWPKSWNISDVDKNPIFQLPLLSESKNSKGLDGLEGQKDAMLCCVNLIVEQTRVKACINA